MNTVCCTQVRGGGAEGLAWALAFHCAPALAGIKAANLVSLQKRHYREFDICVARCECQLQGKVTFFRLQECSQRTLLLIYNHRLETQLKLDTQKRFLLRFGYDMDHISLTAALERLRGRMEAHQSGGEYPHEIGVFLGYPLADVLGFIQHGGSRCKLSGYWKVYGDRATAEALFHAYDTVRSYYCEQVIRGEKIHTIHYGGNDYEQGSGSLLVGYG